MIIGGLVIPPEPTAVSSSDVSQRLRNNSHKDNELHGDSGLVQS
jgi:hypothetical protein